MNRLFVLALIISFTPIGCVSNKPRQSTVGVCVPGTTTPININEGPCVSPRLREPNAEHMMQLIELSRLIGNGTYQ
jgi:hypothetical protein